MWLNYLSCYITESYMWLPVHVFQQRSSTCTYMYMYLISVELIASTCVWQLWYFLLSSNKRGLWFWFWMEDRGISIPIGPTSLTHIYHRFISYRPIVLFIIIMFFRHYALQCISNPGWTGNRWQAQHNWIAARDPFCSRPINISPGLRHAKQTHWTHLLQAYTYM